MNLQLCLKILELETTATLQEAKRAYKDLVRVWHPDRFQNNPRLQRKAEQRLREINLAYKYLCCHLESNQARALSTLKTTRAHSSTGGGHADYAGPASPPRPASNAPGIAGGSKPKSGPSAVPLSKAAAPKPFIGRYVLLAFLGVFLTISALVVYYLYNTDELASRTKGVASEAMDTILEHLEKKQPVGDGDSREKRFIEGLDRNVHGSGLQPEFEIHLDSGSIIMTEAWWEEGDMIMYRVDGGSIGIERSRVKKIVKR